MLYLARMQVKREENTKVESRYMIGDGFTNSCFLDEDFNPLSKDKDGFSLYDYRLDFKNPLELKL
ncbi:hypothetical protein CDFC105_100922 [Clostridioides difficile]|nr:hypothetical protein CDFC105_100922 [Clostridioides difficile]